MSIELRLQPLSVTNPDGKELMSMFVLALAMLVSSKMLAIKSGLMGWLMVFSKIKIEKQLPTSCLCQKRTSVMARCMNSLILVGMSIQQSWYAISIVPFNIQSRPLGYITSTSLLGTIYIHFFPRT